MTEYDHLSGYPVVPMVDVLDPDSKINTFGDTRPGGESSGKHAGMIILVILGSGERQECVASGSYRRDPWYVVDGSDVYYPGGELIAPSNTVLPVITGDTLAGETLTVNTGTWSGSDTLTYEYNWKREGAYIGNRTNSYTIVAGDLGSTFTCEVTATNEGGVVTVETLATDPVVDSPIYSSDSRMLFWFDASDTDTITDTGGLVDQWDDKSSNANHLTSTGASRPTTGASTVNGLNVIDFNGTNSLALDEVIPAKSAGTLFVVAKNTDGTNGSCVVARTTTYGVNFLILDAAAGTSLRLAGSGIGSVNSDSLADVTQMTTAKWSGTTSAVRINSNDDNNTVSAGTPDFSVGVIGDYNTTAFDMTGNIMELIYYDEDFSSADALEIERYLADKWAINGGYSASPSNDAPPAISGTENVGETLSVTTGDWTSYSSLSFLYQWYRDGVAIGSANSSTYDLVLADQDAIITCSVSAVNASGSTAQLSNATGAIAEEVSEPTIVGFTDPGWSGQVATFVPITEDYGVYISKASIGTSKIKAQAMTINPDGTLSLLGSAVTDTGDNLSSIREAVATDDGKVVLQYIQATSPFNSRLIVINVTAAGVITFGNAINNVSNNANHATMIHLAGHYFMTANATGTSNVRVSIYATNSSDLTLSTPIDTYDGTSNSMYNQSLALLNYDSGTQAGQAVLSSQDGGGYILDFDLDGGTLSVSETASIYTATPDGAMDTTTVRIDDSRYVVIQGDNDGGAVTKIHLMTVSGSVPTLVDSATLFDSVAGLNHNEWVRAVTSGTNRVLVKGADETTKACVLQDVTINGDDTITVGDSFELIDLTEMPFSTQEFHFRKLRSGLYATFAQKSGGRTQPFTIAY